MYRHYSLNWPRFRAVNNRYSRHWGFKIRFLQYLQYFCRKTGLFEGHDRIGYEILAADDRDLVHFTERFHFLLASVLNFLFRNLYQMLLKSTFGGPHCWEGSFVNKYIFRQLLLGPCQIHCNGLIPR